jgi:Nif-specific regulatory protein
MSTPKIIAIAGPLKGSIVELGETNVTVGRDVSNTLHLDDKMVSRCHCTVQREKGLYKITDLESHNGTLINGIPIKEQVLKHGDRLQIGNNFFLFLLFENKDAANSNTILFEEGTVQNSATIKLSLEDVLYSMASDLNLLLRTSQTISTATSLKALERQLLEGILDAIPAERGAILLVDDPAEEPISIFALDKLLGPTLPVHISRTVVRNVLTQGGALLSNNVSETDLVNQAKSLVAAQTRSLLCVPVMLQKKAIGVIYLETTESGVSFSEDHLKIVTALTSFASGALKTLQHMEWLETENKRLLDDIRLEHNMIGESAQMREVYQFISKVGPTDSTVLIRGESGTGKELVARAIHQSSHRAAKPFVAINCAALTESLLESELFGYEKGAFTGAYAQKKGKLELADGGHPVFG